MTLMKTVDIMSLQINKKFILLKNIEKWFITHTHSHIQPHTYTFIQELIIFFNVFCLVEKYKLSNKNSMYFVCVIYSLSFINIISYVELYQGKTRRPS